MTHSPEMLAPSTTPDAAPVALPDTASARPRVSEPDPLALSLAELRAEPLPALTEPIPDDVAGLFRAYRLAYADDPRLKLADAIARAEAAAAEAAARDRKAAPVPLSTAYTLASLYAHAVRRHLAAQGVHMLPAYVPAPSAPPIDRDAEIRRLFAQGATRRAIGEALGVTAAAVRRILNAV